MRVLLPKPARWSSRVWITVGIGALVIGGGLYLAALFFAENLLQVESTSKTADAIVLLGGDRLYRPLRAAGLYLQGAAPVIIVAGKGDCEEMKIIMCRKGVPAEAIETECASRTTSENARFAIPMLRARGVKRVIIVTSWFHSRRALHCFRHYAPDLDFISLPTREDLPQGHWPSKRERGSVLEEYPKFLWYWARYGVTPF